MKNKDLLIKNESFFSKIATFLRKYLFKKRNMKNAEYPTDTQLNLDSELKNEIIENFTYSEEEEKAIYSGEYDLGEVESNAYEKNIIKLSDEEEKRRFLEIYNNYKDGLLDVSCIKGADLYKINKLLEEEIKIIDNNIKASYTRRRLP